jgi:Family of unknown function (DUF5995)
VTTGAATELHERLAAVAERLDARARELDERRDSRAVFTHAYALMTTQIAKELPTDPSFDPGWTVSLAEAFAARYFAALDAWDRGSGVPPAWDTVFRAICDRRTSVVEDLVFAMTAHIVRDLPHALLDVGLRDSSGRPHVHDFHAVNDVLGHEIQPIVNATSSRYGRYVKLLDRLGKPYDRIITNYGIRLSRGVAWYNAMRLEDAAEAADASDSIEKSPGVVVDQALDPPVWSLRILLRFVRWVLGFLRKWPQAGPARRAAP